MKSGPCIFALGASRPFGARLCRALNLDLASHEERDFAGGEHKARPLESVRDRDVYVLHALYGDGAHSANDKLCRLLFFVGALRDAGAARVTALVPYLAYARKDRRTRPRDPVTSRYVATLFEAVGTDRIVVLDVHNPAAFENAFRCRAENLEARGLFAEHLAPRLAGEACAVVSPDAGGAKRAAATRDVLQERLGREVGLAFMEKRRSEDVVSGELLVGDVRGRTVLIYDDLVSSGTTIVRATRAIRAAGARRIIAAATHAAFTAGADQLAGADAPETLLVTDTIVGLAPAALAGRLETVPAAALFAEAVRRLHTGASLVDLAGP